MKWRPKAMRSACPEAMAALPDSRVWPPAESSLVSPRIKGRKRSLPRSNCGSMSRFPAMRGSTMWM